MRLSPIRDEFGETTGVLFLAQSGGKRDIAKRYGLSPREVQVAQLLASGLTGKEIGERLGITERTVKAHTTRIYRKLNLKNRSQFIRFMRTIEG